MTIKQKTVFEALLKKLGYVPDASLKSDLEKAYAGNAAAARRSRNDLSELGKICKDVRKEVLVNTKEKK